jgi:ribosomal protein L11 methyltransferase
VSVLSADICQNAPVFAYCLPGTLESLDHLTPALWDAGAQGLEERGDSLLAYFENPVELPFDGVWLESDDTDWIAKYRASLKPVQVGRIIINPGWDLSPNETSDDIVIDLEPGLAFGTGQHETTRLAIRALQNLDLNNTRVLDVGAGSGILALVAAKLGATAIGVDNDEKTVPVARDNAIKNQANVEFISGILEDVLDRGPFAVVVANLFAELHDLLMAQYKLVLEPGGTLIMTGILAGTEQADAGERITWDTSSGRETLVVRALEREGLSLLRREQEGEWVMLEARNP